MSSLGTIGILNVGAGDTKLIFDQKKPEDCARAARTVADMISRGYVILIEAGKDEKSGEPLYRRAKAFDPETCEYIIAGDVLASSDEGDDHEQQEAAPKAARARAKKDTDRRIHASRASGVAVPRQAGG